MSGISSDYILQRFGDWVTVSRGAVAVRCIGYVRPTTPEERANSADEAPAIFVLQHAPLQSMGLHKFDKIETHGKTHTVIEASVRYAGAEPVLYKGTCSA